MLDWRPLRRRRLLFLRWRCHSHHFIFTRHCGQELLRRRFLDAIGHQLLYFFHFLQDFLVFYFSCILFVLRSTHLSYVVSSNGLSVNKRGRRRPEDREALTSACGFSSFDPEVCHEHSLHDTLRVFLSLFLDPKCKWMERVETILFGHS